MRSRRFFFFFAIVGLFLSIQTQADILMIDFNNSVTEITAAQRAARMRGERLIVIPDANHPARRELAQVQSQIRALQSRIEKNEDAYNRSFYQQLDTLHERKTTLGQAFAINAKSVSEAVANLAKQGTKFSSVVISGHDGNGQFAGDYNGSMMANDFGEIFKKNPQMFAGTRSMLLWGCYTGTPASLEFSWKKQLPGLELLAGFDEMAPLSSTLASPAQLEDILVREKTLTSQKDLISLQQQFNSIRYVNMTYLSVCAKGKYVNSRERSTIQNLLEGCTVGMINSGLKDKFRCYFNATEGCDDPPAETGASSPIRQFYNNLQGAEHCRSRFHLMDENDTPYPDQVIRLIFYDNFKKNFQQNHKPEIEEMNQLLEKMDAPQDLRFGDLSRMTRKEILDLMTKLENFSSSKLKDVTVFEKLKGAEAVRLSGLVRFSSSLLRLNDYGPFGWVEANSTIKAPVQSRPDSREIFYAHSNALQDSGASQARLREFYTEKLKDRNFANSDLGRYVREQRGF